MPAYRSNVPYRWAEYTLRRLQQWRRATLPLPRISPQPRLPVRRRQRGGREVALVAICKDEAPWNAPS